MWTLWGRPQGRFCDRISRRHFLQVGGLTVGGLGLADLLRLPARGTGDAPAGPKAVIMMYLKGGPSHIDMYDMKPAAPVEYRGEFQPIDTNVPGMQICEHMPLQARIADKLAIIRNLTYRDHTHEATELLSGFVTRDQLRKPRPVIGAVAGRMMGSRQSLPPYVSLMRDAMDKGDQARTDMVDWEMPAYLGKAHGPFRPRSGGLNAPGLESLQLHPGITLEQLGDRKGLLQSFDQLGERLDETRGLDAVTAQALDILSSPRTRQAFDLSQEPERVRAKYGDPNNVLDMNVLLARRLVEAGVRMVTLTIQPRPSNNSVWDTHSGNFKSLKNPLLPTLDRAVYALVTDLHERGLDKDVAVVVWGEMGRAPKVGDGQSKDGRNHWPQLGFAVLAGGGLRTGQVIGASDARAERARGTPYTPQNVLATLYQVLGIDPAATLNDHDGRPIHLLDDPKPVVELL